MAHSANLNGVFAGVDEKQPIIAGAKPHLLKISQLFTSPSPDSANRCRLWRTRIAVGLSRARTSALACSVHTIRFKPVPGNY